VLECGLSQKEGECHILVVESSPELRRVMVLLLEDEGHTVVQSATPEEAMALLSDSGFDLVITDTFGRSSQDALESASGVLEAAAGTPVALCTGYRFTMDEVRRAGFSDIIRKPFEPEVFLERVRGLCTAEGAAA